MGAWEELDTEITVDVDLTGLDEFSNLDEDIFEPVIESISNLKVSIDDKCKEGVEDIARRNKSFQEQIIASTCKNPSGMLQSSIQEEEINGGYGFIVGTIINHIYPMALEYGRGEVYPIHAKALAFYADSGELIFRKKVGRAEPRPFVAPAYERTDAIAKDIMLMKIDIAKSMM